MEHDDSYATGVLTECTIQVCGWIYCICMTSKSRLLLEKSAKSMNSIDFPYFGWLTLFEIRHFDFGCLGSGSFRRIFPISLGLRWEKSKCQYHDVGGLQVCQAMQTNHQYPSVNGWMVWWFVCFANVGSFGHCNFSCKGKSARKSFYWIFHPFFNAYFCGVRNTT